MSSELYHKRADEIAAFANGSLPDGWNVHKHYSEDDCAVICVRRGGPDHSLKLKFSRQAQDDDLFEDGAISFTMPGIEALQALFGDGITSLTPGGMRLIRSGDMPSRRW